MNKPRVDSKIIFKSNDTKAKSNETKTSTKTAESILLESPSSSLQRVTFDCTPTVKFIPLGKEKNPMEGIVEEVMEKVLKNGTGNATVERKGKRPFKFEVRDKSIILCKTMLKVVQKRAKKYSVIIPSATNVTLKYRMKEDLETDLRALGLKPKTYVENRLIVHNFSFKETEESVLKFFSQFAPTEKVILEKNTKGFCKGKGTITFSTTFNPIHESKLYNLRMNGRLLRVERMKRQVINSSRLFISHMNKNLKISDLRIILKENRHIPKSIKIDLIEGRNRGYGFIEFGSPQEAEAFIEDYENMKSKLGEESFVEFSQEKNLNSKNNKK